MSIVTGNAGYRNGVGPTPGLSLSPAAAAAASLQELSHLKFGAQNATAASADGSSSSRLSQVNHPLLHPLPPLFHLLLHPLLHPLFHPSSPPLHPLFHSPTSTPFSIPSSPLHILLLPTLHPLPLPAPPSPFPLTFPPPFHLLYRRLPTDTPIYPSTPPFCSPSPLLFRSLYVNCITHHLHRVPLPVIPYLSPHPPSLPSPIPPSPLDHSIKGNPQPPPRRVLPSYDHDPIVIVNIDIRPANDSSPTPPQHTPNLPSPSGF